VNFFHNLLREMNSQRRWKQIMTMDNTSGPELHANNMEYGMQINDQGNSNEAETEPPVLRRSSQARISTA
jgi:hypothetical protein